MNRKFEFVRTLNKKNIDNVLQNYLACIEHIEFNTLSLKGAELLLNIKREKIGVGPYPTVSLFEAANRIMTDLVILNGVKFLIDYEDFPFTEFSIEYGNEDKNNHDIMAENGELKLAGEAFNVAPSFYQTKKRKSLLKLNNISNSADVKLIIANSDSVPETYRPKVDDGTYYLFVGPTHEQTKLFSS